MKKGKHILPLCILGLVWTVTVLSCWMKPDTDFSVSERRRLKTAPEWNFQTKDFSRYSAAFEDYALDQFPLRDYFRTLKAFSEFYLFGKKDHQNIYISEGYAAKMEYPLNESSVHYAVERMNDLYKAYLENTAGNVYLSIVPDKSYFMAEQTGHLTMDYDVMFDMVKQNMPYAEYIDITTSLEMSDYYKTDSHWRQEELFHVAEKLASEMGSCISGVYDKKMIEQPFYGVYYGQSALPLKSDTMYYLSNEVLDTCKVYNVETKETTGLYHLDKIESYDMYDIYLSGATSLLMIENPKATEQKELVVFRDSFASSIVPLLAEGYSKITLIDIRYMQPEKLGEYVDFKKADVLFLYSTTLLNNSQSLRRMKNGKAKL